MTRPFARYNGHGHRRDIHDLPQAVVDNQQRLAGRAIARALARARAMEIVERCGELYSVELAAVTGWDPIYAKLVLVGLERDRRLVGEHRVSPLSGHGRRYFRLPPIGDGPPPEKATS